jgi:hypothetical protein
MEHLKGANGMRNGVSVAVAAMAVSSLALIPIAAQAPAATASGYRGSRTPDGKPNLNGIWQTFSTAHWNLEAHTADDGIPAGQSVVEGNDIPYQPAALAQRRANFEKGRASDPLAKCHLPGVPRITYIPFPFQIVQTPKHVSMLYEYSNVTRIIYTDGTPHPPPLELWMGDSRGRWEGDTLVVDVTQFNDMTWFDMAGNFHSDALHVVERYTPLDADHVRYEATIEDPKVFTRPWKMNLLLYRRLEQNLQILDYVCVDFVQRKYLTSK